MKFKFLLVPLLCLIGLGCSQQSEKKPVVAEKPMPVFTIAPSEYPSWATFMVARKAGLIGKTLEDKPGTLEKKWGVRVALEVKDYDTCISMYGSGTADAVCITNIDCLNPAMGRKSVAILPTSTSASADKVIGVNIDTIEQLQGYKTFGLSKSVSEYLFLRGLESRGVRGIKEYKFENLDPAAAATAVQTGSADVRAICVWNPFALQTLRSTDKAKVLFDSTAIPEEIIDMVVVGDDVLKREGGDKFASLLCDVYYTVCQKMTNPESADAVYKALGEDFSNLGVADMKICCRETSFYATPQDGIKLFSNQNFQNNKMPQVIKTCQELQILTDGKAPTIGWNDDKAQLNFSTTYMQSVIDSQSSGTSQAKLGGG